MPNTRTFAEFDQHDERLHHHQHDAERTFGGPITYDTAAIRRELGLA